ncbi:DUF732 domain-containing protein [Mycolicibacter longobardus]|uniref:DUF732 domain-containing protein n=1 Tax=Mycolicibacter longobardus TaxID=1108812 RepID=UPI000A14B8A6|nr:DUF732 domain-containing protein [Mycolicibacter longobardus]MCV7384547.1 DUF732 domain-containing protein [Mycolicibacter longobardus]
MKLLFVPLVATAAIAVAAPGHAEPGVVASAVDNAEFVASLQQIGITFADPAQAVSAAEAVCGLAANGETGLELLNDITDANPALSVPDAARFAAIAAKSYCPQQLQKGGGGSK